MIVQLLGKHPSVADAPVIAGASRWIINNAYDALGDRWDVLFELHRREDVVARRPHVLTDAPRFAAAGKRLICLEGEFAYFEAYPRAQVQAFFHDDQIETSFQSSLDWMLALAIVEGATWIDLQGAELRAQHEYLAQRESFRYWMGQARGRGIRVTVPPASGLNGAHRLYGYEIVTGQHGPPGEREIVYGVPGRGNPRLGHVHRSVQ